jgi:uncharacterized protein (UPF0335 family)
MFLSHGTILNCKKGDFVSEKESLDDEDEDYESEYERLNDEITILQEEIQEMNDGLISRGFIVNPRTGVVQVRGSKVIDPSSTESLKKNLGENQTKNLLEKISDIIMYRNNTGKDFGGYKDAFIYLKEKKYGYSL